VLSHERARSAADSITRAPSFARARPPSSLTLVSLFHGFRLSPSLSLSAMRTRREHSLAGVHWTILRAGFAAVKMMEWPGQSKKRKETESLLQSRNNQSSHDGDLFSPSCLPASSRSHSCAGPGSSIHESRGASRVTPSEIKRASKSERARKLARERRQARARARVSNARSRISLRLFIRTDEPLLRFSFSIAL